MHAATAPWSQQPSCHPFCIAHLLLALSKGSTGFLVCFGGAALQHLHPLAKKQFLPLQSVHGAAAMLVARHT